MFADLMDHATRADSGVPPLRIPIHAPPLPSDILPAAIATAPNAPMSIGSLMAPSPSALAEGCVALLQAPLHAGYIYYLAAICAMERRAKFRKAVEAGDGIDEKTSGFLAFKHERSVDHEAQIIEVSTEEALLVSWHFA